MASAKAFQAMARGDWNVVTEMLDMDELSTVDINQPHPMVDIHRSSLFLYAVLLTATLSISYS